MKPFFNFLFNKNKRVDNESISLDDVAKDSIISNDNLSIIQVSNRDDIQNENSEILDSFVKHKTREQYEENNSLVLGVSIVGKSHISEGIECQDCHRYKFLGNDWGIAIVSDGAGSALNAERGSNAVCNIGIKLVEELIQPYIEKKELPDEKEWALEIRAIFEIIRDLFVKTAEKEDIDPKTFNATVLILVHTPFGMLVAHIGDGRMGYLDNNNVWHALITPHSGEEANQTIFITSDWNIISNLKMSDVYVPETRVVKDLPKAFVLMSDGCENAIWECRVLNDILNKYEDLNRPFERFLSPMINMILEKENLDERFETFIDIIDKGNNVLERETDDKTLLLGILKS